MAAAPEAKLDQEEDRIRAVYARRDLTGKSDLYGHDRPDMAYIQQRCQDAWREALAAVGALPPAGLEVLDLGCGFGGWLRMLVQWGAEPGRVHGVDLLGDRIEQARRVSPPEMDLRVGSGLRLDFDAASFDLCAASTVFSSIPDPQLQQALAAELSRVLRPGGWLLVFDFVISDPRNPDTVGVGPARMRALFPELRLAGSRRLLLPAPLLRRLPGALFFLVGALESLGCIPTHRLYRLRKV